MPIRLSAALLAATRAAAPIAARAALIASYAMADGTDSSGNGLNLTLSGTSADTGRPGGDGSALAFDGTSSFAQYAGPSTGLLSIGARDWTVSAWVKPASTAAGVRMIVGRCECGFFCAPGGPTNAAITNLYLSDNKPGFAVRTDSETFYAAESASALAPGDWHWLAGVLNRSGGTLSLYVDGTLAASVAYGASETVTDTDTPLSIGREFRQGFASPYRYFAGSIDDVAIYDETLLVVPEPGSLAMGIVALTGLAAARARRRAAAARPS